MFFMSYSHTSNSGISVPLPFVDFLDGPNCSTFVLTTWLSQFSEFASSSLEVTDSQSSFYNCIDLLNSFTQSWQVHALGFLIFDDLRQDRVAVATQNQFCLYYRFIASWPFSWHWLIAIILTFQIENLSDRLITFSISLDGSILPHIRSFAHLHIAILGHLGHPIWVIQVCLQFPGFQFDFFFLDFNLDLSANSSFSSCDDCHFSASAIYNCNLLIANSGTVGTLLWTTSLTWSPLLRTSSRSLEAMSSSVPSPCTPPNPPGMPRLGNQTLEQKRNHVWGWYATMCAAFTLPSLPSSLSEIYSEATSSFKMPSWLQTGGNARTSCQKLYGFSPQVQYQSDRRELHLGARSIVQSFTVHSRPPSTPCKAGDPHRGPGCIFGAFGTAGAQAPLPTNAGSDQAKGKASWFCRQGAIEEEDVQLQTARCFQEEVEGVGNTHGQVGIPWTTWRPARHLGQKVQSLCSLPPWSWGSIGETGHQSSQVEPDLPELWKADEAEWPSGRRGGHVEDQLLWNGMRKRRGLSLLCLFVIPVSRCDVILTCMFIACCFLIFILHRSRSLIPGRTSLFDLLRLRLLRHLRGVIDQPSFSCD